mmetsp:Transcript_12743/g.46609  ORF Transcript_12743/g.46609 Transcript_12743/m.46609 type:complete len:191 (-) Transcript_12743:2123-2695(-)
MNGLRTFLHIGEGCSIREGVVIHPGTDEGSGLTHVGDNCLVMSGVHIGHDVRVGDGVVVSANTSIGGHVHVGNGAVIGGQSAVHQFVHIGQEAMVGGHTAVSKDVPPWSLVKGSPAALAGINLIRLRRLGVPRREIRDLLQTYRYVFGQETMFQGKGMAFAPPLNLPPLPTPSQRARQVCHLLYSVLGGG